MPELSTPARVTGFLAGLVLVFVTALGVGTWVGPLDEPGPSAPAPSDTHLGGTGEH